MVAQIKLWGNSQGIRIPKGILDSVNIGVNDQVNIEVINDSIVISKIFKHRTLEERFAQFEGEIDPISETDFDYGEPVGREVW